MPENTYEITYIVNSVLSDDQIRNLVGRVTKFIEKEGGNIVEVDEWGAQRLAYPIDKKRTGYYVNAYFEAGGELIARLERALTLEDDILRFLTLKMDAVMLRHYEERKEERAREKAEGAKESAPDKEAQVSVAQEQTESPPAPKEETKAAEVSPEETKAEASAEEKKAEVSAKEAKAEASAEETKAEAPAEEKKTEASAKQAKAETPAPKEEAEAEPSAEDAKASDKA